MASAYLNEFYKHVSTDSILVVTSNGELMRLYCPFKVKSLVAFPDILAGSIQEVIRVQINQELKDVFIIGEKAYFATFFQILMDTSVHPSSLSGGLVGWIILCTQLIQGKTTCMHCKYRTLGLWVQEMPTIICLRLVFECKEKFFLPEK